MHISLLIVEDDKNQLQMYNDAIDSFSKQNHIEIRRTCLNSLAEGMEAIRHNIYDAAIIDMKLSAKSTELEGMDLVNAINGKLRIPIYIVSGSIAQVEISENALFKKRLRTVDFKKILGEIKGVYDTGITRFLRQGGQIDEMLSSIFWNHLAKDLDVWVKNKNSDTLLRYILSHFLEYLDIRQDGYFEEYHPFEVYIKPPIKNDLHTGDLVRYSHQLYLILTPACDIVVQRYENLPDGRKTPIRKADKATLIKVNEFDYKDLCKGNNGKVEKGKINEYVMNKMFRYHYLPPFDNQSGFLIDFQDISSVNILSNFDRIASISSPFIKDIISRFSNYYSRQGQPTFQQKSIVEELFESK